MILNKTSLTPSRLLILLFLLNLSSYVYAANWEIRPFVESRVGYSDNIELQGQDEEDGFIGQVNPGVSVLKQDGRLQVKLDYLMQNFYYVDGSELNTDNNLDAIARYEILPSRFFLNGYANISQLLIDSNQVISVDNLNDTGNTTDERTFGIEPVWAQDLGSYMQANLSYLYAIQDFKDESDEDGVAGDIDDNDRQRFLASLDKKDVQSDRFDWTASYLNEKVDFEDGQEFDFSYQQIELGYDLFSRLKIVGTYGYENNDFGNVVAIDEDEDGIFWDAGFIYGLGEFAAFELRRGERFFGKTWEADLKVGGPKLAFNARYEESTDLELLDTIDSDSFNQEVNLLQNDIDTGVTNDRDSVAITKTWDGTLSYTVSKSTLVANFTNEDIEFLDSNDTEKYQSYAFGWLWNITGISSLFATVEWQEDESDDQSVTEKSDLFDFGVVYTRRLSPKADFDVTYNHAEGESDAADEDFTSNTISVGLLYRF